MKKLEKEGRGSSLAKNMGGSMTGTPSTIGKPPLKAIGLSGTAGKKNSKDVIRRLRKSLVITLLLRIQNLHINAWTDPFRDLLFEKLKEFKELYERRCVFF